ncbi:MAG: sigma-70 family RNA polymerase sigma factor, partial [Planctomycetota bacterium]
MDTHKDQRITDFLASHHAIAWKIARSFSNVDADCNDLFQEICISLWTAFDNIPDDVRDTTYVYRVALNRAISWRRKRESYLRHLKNYLLGNETTAVSYDHAPADETEQLYAAIRQLSESDRSLI